MLKGPRGVLDAIEVVECTGLGLRVFEDAAMVGCVNTGKNEREFSPW